MGTDTSMTGTYDLSINQFATYEKTFVWIAGGCGCGTVGARSGPVDLTGYTAQMQFRNFPGAPLIYDASSDITLGGVDGSISLEISASDTAGFTWAQARYDLLLISPQGIATRLLQGAVTVNSGITP